MKKLPLLLIISVLFVSCTTEEEGPVWKGTITEEDGVVVVHNPEKPGNLPGLPSTLKLREDLRIGDESGDKNYMFWLLVSIQVSDEEEIIAFDRREQSIKVYDREGKFIRKFGQRGQGPGDMLEAKHINLVQGNKISLLDPGNSRFSYYSIEGKVIQEIRIGIHRPWEAKADSRGNIYGYFPNYIARSAEDRRSRELVKFNQEMKPIMTIISIDMPKKRIMPIFMEHIRFHVLKDEYLIWGRTYNYEFNILDSDGNLVRQIEKEYSPIIVTTNNLLEFLKKRFWANPPQSISNKELDAFPKHFPSFQDFICDDEGRIYVRTYEMDKEYNVFYDVFDAEGRYFARFSLPFEEELSVIKKKKMYSMLNGVSSEEGIPMVKRYEMKWEN